MIPIRSARVAHNSETLVHRPVERRLRLQLLENLPVLLRLADPGRPSLPLRLPGEPQVSHVAGTNGGCDESFQNDLQDKHRQTRLGISGQMLFEWLFR